ncbi:helix-turn-helix domain-containing protein [Enterobacteriaceae bacterium ESL0689]|nr:helix-turn-helix domain-containing protein [Enterobacteriaceae bacterium ESL0689]
MTKIQNTEIGARIRARRKAMNLTQKALAKILKISDVSISQWERGDSEPTGKNLHALCEALRSPASWILFGDENRAPEKPNDQLVLLDERQREILHLFDSIRDEEQETFLSDLRTKAANNEKLLEELLKVQKRIKKK